MLLIHTLTWLMKSRTWLTVMIIPFLIKIWRPKPVSVVSNLLALLTRLNLIVSEPVQLNVLIVSVPLLNPKGHIFGVPFRNPGKHPLRTRPTVVVPP